MRTVNDIIYVVTITLCATLWIFGFLWMVNKGVERFLSSYSYLDESLMGETAAQIGSVDSHFESSVEHSSDEVSYTFYFGEDIPFEEEKAFFLNSSSWKYQYRGVKMAIEDCFRRNQNVDYENRALLSEGFTELFPLSVGSVVTNTCFDPKHDLFTFYSKNGEHIRQTISSIGLKDFYHNDFRILTTPVHPAHLSKDPLHLLVIHPLSYADLLSFMKGVSLLASVAFHCELFPPIDTILLVGDKPLNRFQNTALRSLLALFPSEHQPKVVRSASFQGVVCDRVMSVLHVNWSSDRLFPSLLETVAFKASAFVYSHFYPDSSKEKGMMLMVKREKIGVILNFDAVLDEMKKRFELWMEIEPISLEKYSMDLLVPLFGRVDVLLAVTGDDLMYSLFMLPNSVVIEVQLDSSSVYEYQNIIQSTELEYLSLPSTEICNGKRKCPKRSRLNKNCTIDSMVCGEKVTQALVVVQEKKFI